MTGQYEREFGKFPWRDEPIHMWPSMNSWKHQLRKREFDADDYVFLGQVQSTLGNGHGGIRFGPDGWAWTVGLGKLAHKGETMIWSDLDYLEIRRDPFSLAMGNQKRFVKFVAVTDKNGFVMGEMADVLVRHFDAYLTGGNWHEADKFPPSQTGPFGGQMEALWKREL